MNARPCILAVPSVSLVLASTLGCSLGPTETHDGDAAVAQLYVRRISDGAVLYHDCYTPGSVREKAAAPPGIRTPKDSIVKALVTITEVHKQAADNDPDPRSYPLSDWGYWCGPKDTAGLSEGATIVPSCVQVVGPAQLIALDPPNGGTLSNYSVTLNIVGTGVVSLQDCYSSYVLPVFEVLP